MDVKKGKPDVRRELFGGEGAVTVWSLVGAMPTPPFSAVLSCELSPGGSVGPHQQERDPEIVVGLGGEGAARVDGVPHALGAGDVVYLPYGSTLALENLSQAEPLRYLIIKAERAHASDQDAT